MLAPSTYLISPPARLRLDRNRNYYPPCKRKHPNLITQLS